MQTIGFCGIVEGSPKRLSLIRGGLFVPLLDLGNRLLAQLQASVSANNRKQLLATIDSTTRCAATLNGEDGRWFSLVLRKEMK